MQRRTRPLQPRVCSNMSGMSTISIRRTVVFAENNTIIYFDDDEDCRRARRGTWIIDRYRFEQRVRQFDILIGSILRRHLDQFRKGNCLV